MAPQIGSPLSVDFDMGADNEGYMVDLMFFLAFLLLPSADTEPAFLLTDDVIDARYTL